MILSDEKANRTQEPIPSLPGLRGKSVVITGAAHGIGESIAELLTSMNMHIGIVDTSPDGEGLANHITRNGGSAFFTLANITSPEEMDGALLRIADRFGGIDFLVNNAGTSSKTPLDQMGIDEWRRIINVNLTGSFITTKSALQYLKKSKSANIVMVSSGSSITGSGGCVAYSASKGGINSLVRALARELAGDNIRVNAVAPRTIRGRMLQQVYTDQEIVKMEQRLPLKRLGTEREIAYVVAFLLSDLSSYITGETILIDGGRTYCSKD